MAKWSKPSFTGEGGGHNKGDRKNHFMSVGVRRYNIPQEKKE